MATKPEPVKFIQIALAAQETENRDGTIMVHKFLMGLDTEGQVWRFIFKTGEAVGYWVKLPQPQQR